MNKYFLVLLLVLPFSLLKAQFQPAQFTDSRGTVLNYQILFPENYDASKKYPLVLFLHGAGERGDDNTSQLNNGAKETFEKLQSAHPAIVIAPQCPKESYWGSVKFSRDKYPLELDFNYSYPEKEPLHAAVELVQSYIKEKKADNRRVYITGLSMGAMGTFEAVARYPKLFAAAMPICGGGDLKAYGKKHAKIPFWIFHGDLDGVVPVKHSREMYAHLQSMGAQVKYTEYPGVNHNSWVNAFSESEYPGWMFQFRK